MGAADRRSNTCLIRPSSSLLLLFPSPAPLCCVEQMNKRVNTRIVQKRLHVRIEHAKHSKCRQVS
jgi:hypothetical protein